jgi:hypothetical protein
MIGAAGSSGSGRHVSSSPFLFWLKDVAGCEEWRSRLVAVCHAVTEVSAAVASAVYMILATERTPEFPSVIAE